MKKATVIIIAAIYVASIVIVGVFGLQALIYTEDNPITDFTMPTEIEGKEVKPTDDGKGVKVTVSYKENLLIPIQFIPVPADATSEVEVTITYQTGSAENPTAVLEHDIGYFLKFYKKGKVTVTIRSTDSRKVSKELSITVI